MLSNEIRRLLLKVKRHILAEPKRLRMDVYVCRQTKANRVMEYPGYNEPKRIAFPTCNTVACIAGWLVVLKDGRKATGGLDSEEISARAQDLLEVNDGEFQALADVNSWPVALRLGYIKARSRARRAALAAARIDHFIEHDGKVVEDEVEAAS